MTRQHPFTRVTRCIVLAILIGSTLLGQVNTATVTGTVSDPTGSAIPNAKVEAKNEATGATSLAVTNTAGRFSLAFLPIGAYAVTVTASGFEGQTSNGIPLTAGQMLDMKISLTVGNVQQNITVAAESGSLSYDTADQHRVLGDENVHNLPLARLDWTGLLQVDSSVTLAGNSNSGVSLNGLPPASFLLTVDGTDAAPNPELPSVGFYQGFNSINEINSDAIAEVSITKGITPASVSGMSGNINIITKGGTNQFHGGVHEFNSVSDYNARNQFLKSTPRSTSNQFGGSFGGPILHDKLFFFVNYEGIRVSSFSALNGTVPTPLFIAQSIAAQPQYKSQFAVFPLPNTAYAPTAVSATWTGAGTLQAVDNNAVGRIDYYLNSKNWLSLRYTDSHPSKTSPRVIAQDSRISSGLSDSYNLQFTHGATLWTAATRVAYTRPDLARVDQLYNLGLDEIKVNGIDSQGGENYQIRGATFETEENISLTRGRHTIEFGGIILRLNDGRIDDTTTTFSYSNTADFLTNTPNQIQINFPLSLFQVHMYQLGGFVQDSFRVTPNLTINAGLRYDYWTVPKERDGRLFTRETGPLGVGTGPFRPPSSVYASSWPNFGPRIGLAWSLGSDRKTVIRAGAGIFFNSHPLYTGVIDDVLDNPNVPFRLTLSRTQALSQNLSFPLDKFRIRDQLEANGTPIATTSIDRGYPNPYSMQWTLGVQRSLPFGLVLDTAFVGNRAVHISIDRMANLPDRVTGVVPDPQYGSYRYYDGSDASWYDSWQTALSKNFASGLNFGVSYNWSHNLSYGDADLQLVTVPQDFNNIRADKGPTPYDIRHSFKANFLYMPPVLQWTGWQSRAAKLLADGWQISGILVATTGLPGNVTNGSSANSTDRPDAAGIDPVLSNRTSLQYLNAAAFLAVPIATASGEEVRPGNLGRYSIRVPGMWNLDLSAVKNFAVTERFKVQLRGDAFNSLNHTNLGGLVTNFAASNFGQLTSATSRSIQIGAKLIF
jgi:outer membrane receptor protein involved in Fe transport